MSSLVSELVYGGSNDDGGEFVIIILQRLMYSKEVEGLETKVIILLDSELTVFGNVTHGLVAHLG